MTIAIIVLALLLDFFFAEPRRFHPLVGFGHWANRLESRFNISQATRRQGVIAWCLAVIPVVFVFFILDRMFAENTTLHLLFSATVLYLAIGWQSLLQHAKAVATPLRYGDLAEARKAVGMIVSRDTQALDKTDVAKAATESVLENGADAIFSALFWFLIAGVPGVVLYRLSNTLDAMWGYKNERFLQFGWCAARVDDVLNFFPARLTALSYALCGQTKVAMQCWREQAPHWKSPNAGPVMSAGAGALLVSLGGEAQYHQQSQQRPVLGVANEPSYQASAQSIQGSCRLVNNSLLLWLAVVAVLQVVL